MPGNLSLEDHLCLLLARSRFSPESAMEAVGSVAAAANWDLLFDRACAHGLIPIVCQRLQALDFAGVPLEFVRKLTDTFGINALRNEMLARELARVLANLGEAKISVIPLKGVALAESVYGDVALRTCADLDILIQPDNLEKCLGILTSAGYKHALAAPPSLRLLARYGRDCALVREDGRWVYPLQVHCGLIWGGPAERRLLSEIWSNAPARPFRTARAYALSRADEFLYLAVHAARHGLSSFKWIVDLDWLISRGSVDWNSVLNQVQKLKWEQAMGYSLSACASLLGTQIPEPLAKICADIRIHIPKTEPGPLEVLRQSVFVLRLLPNFPRRVAFLAMRVFIPTSADGEIVRLPPSLFFLYFLLRPCRLILKVLKWVVQAGVSKVRGDEWHSASR